MKNKNKILKTNFVRFFSIINVKVPKKNMQELDINGITVKYPFIPYDVQKHYMQSVIRSLDSGENALLESPTGL